MTALFRKFRANLPMLLIMAVVSCQPQGLRTGDLLFFAPEAETGAQSMDSAIQDATGGGYIHVGIVEADDEGALWIIEATPRQGVHRSRIDKNWLEAQKDEGYRMDAKRLKGCSTLKESVLRAKDLIGRPYDFAFQPGLEALYCSELVYESFLNPDGSHIFHAAPMNFLSEDGTLNRYWTDLFDDLGEPVPQGLPGTNPQDMSKEKMLVEISHL